MRMVILFPRHDLQRTKMIYTAYRLYKAFLISFRYAKRVFRYALTSKETATFTYNLTPENETYLMNMTAQVVNKDVQTIEHYFNELKENTELREFILYHLARSPFRKKKDKRCDYGNKLALYAFVRAAKPKVVVENGVEAGFTSVVLCEALRKNIAEGYSGKFIGLDINKDSGYLINAAAKYKSVSEMKYGDALECLSLLDTKIDLYFSDGLRTYQYEQDEFVILEKKINEDAIVVTNKATFSKALFELSQRLNRRFSFFKEQPLDHWYEGAGIGFMHS